MTVKTLAEMRKLVRNNRPAVSRLGFPQIVKGIIVSFAKEHGGNVRTLSNKLGLSEHTLQKWIDDAETTKNSVPSPPLSVVRECFIVTTDTDPPMLGHSFTNITDALDYVNQRDEAARLWREVPLKVEIVKRVVLAELEAK